MPNKDTRSNRTTGQKGLNILRDTGCREIANKTAKSAGSKLGAHKSLSNVAVSMTHLKVASTMNALGIPFKSSAKFCKVFNKRLAAALFGPCGKHRVVSH